MYWNIKITFGTRSDWYFSGKRTIKILEQDFFSQISLHSTRRDWNVVMSVCKNMYGLRRPKRYSHVSRGNGTFSETVFWSERKIKRTYVKTNENIIAFCSYICRRGACTHNGRRVFNFPKTYLARGRVWGQTVGKTLSPRPTRGDTIRFALSSYQSRGPKAETNNIDSTPAYCALHSNVTWAISYGRDIRLLSTTLCEFVCVCVCVYDLYNMCVISKSHHCIPWHDYHKLLFWWSDQ